MKIGQFIEKLRRPQPNDSLGQQNQSDAINKMLPRIENLRPFFLALRNERDAGKIVLLSKDNARNSQLLIREWRKANLTNQQFLEFTGFSIPEIRSFINIDL